MEINFKGKRALVTGAGKGIGRSTAKALVKAGAEVIALTRTQADLDSLVAEVPSIIPLCIDVTKTKDVVKAIEGLGNIHLLVNNAATAKLNMLVDVKPEEFDAVFEVNVKAPLFVAQAVARKMIAGGYGGAIVNISSIGSVRAVPQYTVNCSAKAALDMLTKSMALELGPHNIRVNSVNPLLVMTEMYYKYMPSDSNMMKQVMDAVPLKKFAEVEDVVNAILFLLSDKAAMINGVHLFLDGGRLVH